MLVAGASVQSQSTCFESSWYLMTDFKSIYNELPLVKSITSRFWSNLKKSTDYKRYLIRQRVQRASKSKQMGGLHFATVLRTSPMY